MFPYRQSRNRDSGKSSLHVQSLRHDDNVDRSPGALGLRPSVEGHDAAHPAEHALQNIRHHLQRDWVRFFKLFPRGIRNPFLIPLHNVSPRFRTHQSKPVIFLLNGQLTIRSLFLQKHSNPTYDVIVIGGGHAGTEAATAAARSGARTALVTPSADNLGVCSCNPSFGGIGKGTMLREIDALDGVVGRVVDRAGVQFRVLNKKKGPAVWGPRAQIDRSLYRRYMKEEVLGYGEKLGVVEGSVADIVVERGVEGEGAGGAFGRMKGVRLEDGRVFDAGCVVITTGTFLGGEIHIGG